MRDVSGEPPDGLHLLLLVDLVLERALLRGFKRVDDCGFTVALLLVLDRYDEEAGIALADTGERRVDRINLALSLCRLADGGFERTLVALGNDGEDRAVVPRSAFEYGVEQAGKSRIGVDDPPLLVDGGDRHRRILEKAHEPHFGRALRIDRPVARAIDDKRPRGAWRAVGPEGDLME